MLQFDPFVSKHNLRWFLKNLKEDKELDSLIEDYIRTALKHRIIMSPSKGPYGEKGKDIVAVENEETSDYCSYIVKRGTLQKNLTGRFGILRQMEEAMLIELEFGEYQGKKRSAVIVHNDNEGYRGAIDRFERHCKSLENKINSTLLLRPIERWDIEVLVDKLFEYGEILKKNATMKGLLDKLGQSYDLIVSFKEKYETIKNSEEVTTQRAMLAEELFEDIKKKEYNLGPFNTRYYKGKSDQ